MRALTAPSEAFFRRSGALRSGNGPDGEQEVSVAGEVAVPSGALYLGPADGENGRDGVVVRVPAGRYRVLVTVAAGDHVRPPRVRAVSVELTPGPEAARSGLPANAFWHESPGEVPVLDPGDGLFLVADAGLRDQHRDGTYPWSGWLADVVAPSLQDARVNGAHSTAIGFPGRSESLVALVFDRADDGSPLETAMFAGFDASGLPVTLHVAAAGEDDDTASPASGSPAAAGADDAWSPGAEAPWASAAPVRSAADGHTASGSDRIDVPAFAAPADDSGSLDDLPWSSEHDGRAPEAPSFDGARSEHAADPTPAAPTSSEAPSYVSPSYKAPSSGTPPFGDGRSAASAGAAAFEPPSFEVPLAPPPAAGGAQGPAPWEDTAVDADPADDPGRRADGVEAPDEAPAPPFWASAAQRRRGDDGQPDAPGGAGPFGAVVGGAAASPEPPRSAQPTPPAPRADTGAVGSFFADDDMPAWADPTRGEHRPVPSFDDVIGDGAGSAWGPGASPAGPLWDAPAQQPPEPQSAFGPAATGPQPRAERQGPGSGTDVPGSHGPGSHVPGSPGPGIHVPVPPQSVPGGVPEAPSFGDPGRDGRAPHVEAAPADPFWSDAGLPVQAAPGPHVPFPTATDGGASDGRPAFDGAPGFDGGPAFDGRSAPAGPTPSRDAHDGWEPAAPATPPAPPEAPWATPSQPVAPPPAGAFPPAQQPSSAEPPFAPANEREVPAHDAPTTPPWATDAPATPIAHDGFPTEPDDRSHDAASVPESTLPAEPEGEGTELVAALDEGLAAVDGGDVHGAVPRLGTVLVGLECGAGELPDVDAAMQRNELTPAQLVDLVVDLQLGAGQANDAIESLRRALASPILSGSPAEAVHLRKRFGELQLRAGDERSAAATLERAERDAADLVRAANGPEDAEYARDYLAHVRFLLADSALKLDDTARSVELADASMREFEDLGLERMAGRAAFLAATGRGALGDEPGRIAAIRDAERMFRRGNELDGLGTALGFLGEDDALRGDYRAAIATFIEARDVLERAGEYSNAAIAAGNLSVCLQQIGEHAAAEDAAHEADRLSARAGSA